MSAQQTQNEKAKWWKSGYAWLVFGGPATVVVASLITVYIAVKGQDPIIDQDYYQHGIDINKTMAQQPKSADERNSLEPAMKARNHAATGVNKTKQLD